jgi:hypothetical protein
MNQKINDVIQRIHPFAWQLICVAISLGFFSLILINRSPNLLRPLSMSLRTGFGLVIPLSTLIIYLAFRIPGRVGQLAGMLATLTLFAMPLAGLWASGQTQTTVLNGLLPLYDAALYYTDALGLLNGWDFSIVSARRPLFPGLLSVLLFLTHYNLMASLAILTGMVALACYFTTREIQRSHGAETAVFTLMIVFLFYRAHSGVAMTENLGVALGVIGFGLLWRGAADLRLSFVWLGLFITTLALNARAGAFFMLPLLILWAGWLLQKNRRNFFRVIFLSTVAVILGFGLNLGLTRLIAVPSGVPFANFSYTFYGLAAGGKSWTHIYMAHPEVVSLPEPEQSKRIYQLAFELMRENPGQTVQGALFNWRMLFSDSWYNIYSYVGGENWIINVVARWGMYLLGLLGIVTWIRDPRDPLKSLVMICILGVFVSVPFLPPTDAYRMRPYAASIIVLAALPALGIKFFLDRLGYKIPPGDPYHEPVSPWLPAGFSILLTVLATAGPVMVKSMARPVNPTPFEACSSDLEMIVVRYDEGTFVNIKRQSLSFIDWMPDYHIGLFRRNSHSLVDKNMIAWAEGVEPNTTILMTLDYSLGQAVIVEIPGVDLPATDTLLQMCGTYQNEDAGKLFEVQEIRTLPQ